MPPLPRKRSSAFSGCFAASASCSAPCVESHKLWGQRLPAARIQVPGAGLYREVVVVDGYRRRGAAIGGEHLLQLSHQCCLAAALRGADANHERRRHFTASQVGGAVCRQLLLAPGERREVVVEDSGTAKTQL